MVETTGVALRPRRVPATITAIGNTLDFLGGSRGRRCYQPISPHYRWLRSGGKGPTNAHYRVPDSVLDLLGGSRGRRHVIPFLPTTGGSVVVRKEPLYQRQHTSPRKSRGPQPSCLDSCALSRTTLPVVGGSIIVRVDELV